MNSKERVIAAIERRPVDKVPLGLYAVDHDTIAAVLGRPTYVRNRCACARVAWEGSDADVEEATESIIQDLIEFYRKLDCVDLLTFKETQVTPRSMRLESKPRRLDKNTYEHADGSVYRLAEASNSMARVHSATPEAELPHYAPEMFADRTPPEPPDPERFEVLDALIAAFGADRYIATHASGITAVTMLGGMEQGLMLMALQPEVIHACNEQKVFQQNHLDQYYIRPGAAGVFMEQDFAGTNGPYLSPDMFRALCFPYMKQRFANAKSYLPHLLFHSCGNTLPLMEMILDAGIDVYESIQTNAEISIEVLARDYGDRLTIWGAIPLEVLNTGTPSDARTAVRENLTAGKRAPGFILGPSHSIAFGTKYDNFMAMLDEFGELREY